METLSWTEMHASGPAPSPRAGHSTAILPNGNLVVWGGGGGQTALTADLHVLDTVHKMWSGALQLTPNVVSWPTNRPQRMGGRP